jgi:hypothetical protein
MFSFVRNSGSLDISLLRAVCDTEKTSCRDADAEVKMTTDDIQSLLDSASDVWSIFNSDSVNALSDGAARSTAESFVAISKYSRTFRQLADGEAFLIVELMNDCNMLIYGAGADEIDMLTALSFWAWEKIETGVDIVCSECGESPCYVFDIANIGMEKVDGCGCHAQMAAKSRD